MTTNDRPTNVNWIPIAPIEVNITVHDVITSLAQKGGTITPPPGADQKLIDLLKQFNDLSTQLGVVASQINQIDPTTLAGQQ